MADTPFGASFGDPRRFMGSSGIGSAIKKGLTAAALEKTGITDWLNNLNKSTDKPVAPPQTQGLNPVSAVPPPAGAMMPQAQIPAAQQAVTTPVPPPAQLNPTPLTSPQPQPVMQPQPSRLGFDILDDKISEFINPKASNDMPVDFDNVQQPRLTGYEYQQQPGYGKTIEIAKIMAGMM